MSLIKIGFISLPKTLCLDEYTASTLRIGSSENETWSSETVVYKYQTAWYHNPEDYIMTCMFTWLLLMTDTHGYQEGDSFLPLSRFLRESERIYVQY